MAIYFKFIFIQNLAKIIQNNSGDLSFKNACT